MSRAHIEELLSRDLDGGLNSTEREELRRAEAADPSLAALRREWAQIGAALRAGPAAGCPPPEVMWQDVRRAIRVAGADHGGEARRGYGWRLSWAGAALAGALVLFVVMGRWSPAPTRMMAKAAPRDVEVEYVETDLPGASPMVYQDEESGWTIVWVAAAAPGEGPVQDT